MYKWVKNCFFVEAAARTFKKFLHVLIFSWGFVESFIVTITALMNRFTKGFRSILTDMYKDNITLKVKKLFFI